MARKLLWIGIGLALLAGAAGIIFSLGFVLSARSALDTPSAMQISFFDMGKNFLIPGDYQQRKNPITSSPEILTQARRIYTARCVVCHDTDGKGGANAGERMYPRASDLTAARTQGKSDGALFWLVENGLPHTGMPGWKGMLTDQEIWLLVTYMRALPRGVPAADTPTPVALAATSAPPTRVAPTATAASQPTTGPATSAPPTAAPTAAATATPAPTTVASSAATAIATVAPAIATTAAQAAPAAATAAAAAAPAAATAAAQAAPALATIAAAAAPSVATVVAAAGGGAGATNEVIVNLENHAFVPDTLEITVGTKVTWINKDDDPHTVTSEGSNPLLDSPEFNKNETFSFVFTQPGEYPYYCVPHDYMRARVIVR